METKDEQAKRVVDYTKRDKYMYAQGFKAAYSRCCKAHGELYFRLKDGEEQFILVCEDCGKLMLSGFAKGEECKWTTQPLFAIKDGAK